MKTFVFAYFLFVLCVVAAGQFSFPAQKTAVVRHTTDSLPPLPAPPAIQRGWVGTFRYTYLLKGKGNQPKPYSYAVDFRRIHTGNIELTRQIKSAIRVNQPDKYNEQRWESWIPEGRKKCWNYVNDQLQEVTVITSDDCCLAPHDHSLTIKAGSTTAWHEGNLHNYNLQCDYTTGTYILSMPISQCEIPVRETWKLNRNAPSKTNYARNVDETRNATVQNYGYFNEMDTLMGRIARGQKEIVVKRAAAVTYRSYLWHDPSRGPVHITPFATGTVVFEMRLKRVGD